MSSNQRILSLKLLLVVSSAVLSLAAVLKFSIPVAADTLASHNPAVWISLHFWLRPPYLYLLVNFIIICILASSKLHQDPPPTVPVAVSELVAKPSTELQTDVTFHRVLEGASDVREKFATQFSENCVEVSESKVLQRENGGDGEDDLSGLRNRGSMEALFLKYEMKPPIPSDCGDRKTAKASSQGTAALGGSEMKDYETLDNTWKMITEGHSAPPWRDKPVDQDAAGRTKESETFNERSDDGKKSELRQSPGWVSEREKRSLSQGELNRRVEAFIERFKEEMRLQREESLKRLKKMISRGAH